MTLGPTIALIPLLDRARGRLARWLTVFGRVPFFFYVLHIPLIHALALVVSRMRTRGGEPLAVHQSPDGESAAARRLHLDPGPPVLCMGRGDRAPLFPLPLVRRSQGKEKRLVAQLSVTCRNALGTPLA